MKPSGSFVVRMPIFLKYIIAAVFLVGLIAVAYFVQKEISADTQTSKVKKTIAINNWDSAGQPYFHQKFGDKTTFRCTTVDVYLSSDTKAEQEKAVQAVIQESGLTLGGTDLKSTVDSLISANNNLKTDADKTKALEALNKTAIVSSSFPNGTLKSVCDRGGSASPGASVDYAVSLKVPAAYAQPAASSSSVPTASSSVKPTVVPSKEASPSATSSNTSNNTDEFTIKKISIYKKGSDGSKIPVKYATIKGWYKGKSDGAITDKVLPKINSLNTGKYNYIEGVSFNKPSDANQDTINLMAYKRITRNGQMIDTQATSQVTQIKFANQDAIEITFAATAEIEADAEDVSVAQPATGQVTLPVSDSDFPSGNNTVIFTTVRRSKASSTGWTPVGGVSFEITMVTEKNSKQSQANQNNIAFAAEETIDGISVPYDKDLVKVYSSSWWQNIINNLKNRFGSYRNYSMSGYIADNGTASKLTLANMPYGIYTITLSKDHFKSVKYNFSVNSGESKTYDLGGLVIRAQKGTEPPSISNATVQKPKPGEDLYKAFVGEKAYLYTARAPWYGWQPYIAGAENSGYDMTEPTYDTDGIPEETEESGSTSWMSTANSQKMAEQFRRCVNTQSQSQLGVSGELGDVLAGLGIARFMDTSTGARTLEKGLKEAALTIGVPYLIDKVFGTDITDTEIGFSLDTDSVYSKCMYIIYGQSLSSTSWNMPSKCKSCFTGTSLITDSSLCQQCIKDYPAYDMFRQILSSM